MMRKILILVLVIVVSPVILLFFYVILQPTLYYTETGPHHGFQIEVHANRMSLRGFHSPGTVILKDSSGDIINQAQVDEIGRFKSPQWSIDSVRPSPGYGINWKYQVTASEVQAERLRVVPNSKKY